MKIIRLAKIEKDLQQRNKNNIDAIETSIEEIFHDDEESKKLLMRLYHSIAQELALIIRNVSQDKGAMIVTDLKKLVNALKKTNEYPYLDQSGKDAIQKLIDRLTGFIDAYEIHRKTLFGKAIGKQVVMDYKEELRYISMYFQRYYTDTIQKEIEKINDEEVMLKEVLKKLAS